MVCGGRSGAVCCIYASRRGLAALFILAGGQCESLEVGISKSTDSHVFCVYSRHPRGEFAGWRISRHKQKNRSYGQHRRIDTQESRGKRIVRDVDRQTPELQQDQRLQDFRQAHNRHWHAIPRQRSPRIRLLRNPLPRATSPNHPTTPRQKITPQPHLSPIGLHINQPGTLP